MASPTLSERLSLFTDAGLIPILPTQWQLHQGTLEMLPYVTSTDATTETDYAEAIWSHPVIRQPLIASQVGLDHFRLGPALGAGLDSVIKHLHLTYHQGMPVFDLQIIQTHRHGLDVLRRRTEELLDKTTASARRTGRLASRLLREPEAYHRQFVGPNGWMARAYRFDYPEPAGEGAAFPPEFYSLVAFANHCATAYPARAVDLPWFQWPPHFYSLLMRRFREGGRFGWMPF